MQHQKRWVRIKGDQEITDNHEKDINPKELLDYLDTWIVHIEESSYELKSGTKVILNGPNGKILEHAFVSNSKHQIIKLSMKL